MSATKFEVGDKLKVCKNLIEGRQYGCIYCNTDMAALGLSGKTFTISVVDINAYQLEGCNFWWTDEMLEPVEKTLDNLCAGDFVRGGCHTRKVLAAIDDCYLLSDFEDHNSTAAWYTVHDLKEFGYSIVEPTAPEPTIEIDGKKYNKSEVEEAIKDLEPIDPSDTDS